MVYAPLLYLTIAGLPGGPLPEAALVRPSPQPPSADGAAGPQRPQPGQGHLEAGGVLPQRQGRGVPVRDGAKRAGAHKPGREDLVHAQVRRSGNASLFFSGEIDGKSNVGNSTTNGLEWMNASAVPTSLSVCATKHAFLQYHTPLEQPECHQLR